MKEINYIHKNDVFIETTASFISWLSFDLARFLKVNEDDHDLLIKNIHLVEARKALLRKLNGYISDMDIQTDNQKNYQKIDLNVRYAIACGKTALDKPLINNFSQDIRETIDQQESDLSDKYFSYMSTLLQKSDPCYIYLKFDGLLEEGINMLTSVISAEGLAKKRAIRKFTIHMRNISEFLETQIESKAFHEFVKDECRSIEGFGDNPSNEKFLSHIIYFWVQIFNLFHSITSELVIMGKSYDESGIFDLINNLEEFETQLLMNSLDINRAYIYMIGYAVEKYEVLSASDQANIAANRSQDFNVEIELQENTHEQSK